MKHLICYFVIIGPAVLAAVNAQTQSPPAIDLSIISSTRGKLSGDMKIAAEFTDKPVRLDGKLDDEAWKSAKFFEFSGAHNDRATRTRFAVIRNQYGVFFAVECFEPDMDHLDSNCDVRDGLFEWFRKDDWIEILIDPSNSGYDYYWFLVNPSGMQTDLCAQAGPDRSWNGRWKAASGRTKKSWIAEIFIPFKTFNRGPTGNKWRFQIARLRVNSGKKYRPEKTLQSRTVWKGKYRKPSTWPVLTGMKLDPRLFAFEISPLSIKPIGNTAGARIFAKITNHTANKITLRPVFEIMMPGMARGLVPHGTGPLRKITLGAITLKPTQTREISAPIHILPQQVAIASLGLYDNKGNLLACSRDRGIRLKCVLSGPGPRLSLYTTQKKAELKFKLAKWTKTSFLKIRFAKKETIVSASKPVVTTSININHLPPGKYAITVTLYSGKKIPGTRKFELHKEDAARSSVVCTDRWAQCIIVDGKPFIPFGTSPMIIHGLKYVKSMTRQMAENGFNTMYLWGGFLAKDKKGKKLAKLDLDTIGTCFDYAADNDLKVILSLGAIMQNEPSSPFYRFKMTDTQRLNLLTELVRFLSSKKQLLGYEIADEPEFFISPEWLERVYKRIKETDPYHLVTINNCRGTRSSLTYQHASDTLGIDYYPAGKWPVSTVGPLTSELVQFAQYKPVKMWIQGYKIFNPRAPSPDELKMMTWSVFARGSSAIFYFIGKPAANLWNAQGQCAREITSLTQAVSSYHRKTLKVEPEGARVYVSYRGRSKASWVIAVNEGSNPVDIKIQLPDNIENRHANVLFENRRVKITKNGQITDHFASYQRHVYKIDNVPPFAQHGETQHAFASCP